MAAIKRRVSVIFLVVCFSGCVHRPKTVKVEDYEALQSQMATVQWRLDDCTRQRTNLQTLYNRLYSANLFYEGFYKNAVKRQSEVDPNGK